MGPLSAGKYNQTVREAPETAARIAELEDGDGAEAAEQIAPNWRLQLGSLGSGNHFIEITLDEQARVWLFLHSGSRGVGNRLARTARAAPTGARRPSGRSPAPSLTRPWRASNGGRPARSWTRSRPPTGRSAR